MIEAGFKEFTLSAWVGMLAPRGTPREVVERLNRDVNLALA
jgi:tripartite-type tricarboxylate transporter receptor subunit TctC